MFDALHIVVVVEIHISVYYNLVSSSVSDPTRIDTLKPIIRRGGSIVG